MTSPDPIADDGPVSPPFLAIALVSAAALGYEVLLLRLFSIIQWHHFAYMIISLALFGYGVSGTFLALAGDLIGRRFGSLFAANAALFGVAAPGCFRSPRPNVVDLVLPALLTQHRLTGADIAAFGHGGLLQ